MAGYAVDASLMRKEGLFKSKNNCVGCDK